MESSSTGKNVRKTLRIRLLGGFAISVDDRKIPEEQLKSRRARNLIKLLALAPAHRLHRDQVIDILWPSSDFSAATSNFHQSVHAARQVLEPAGAGCLVLEEGFLSLAAVEGPALWVDVDQFEKAGSPPAFTLASDPQGPMRYQAALDLYQGNLLPDDLYEEWTIQRREALIQRYLVLLLDLSRLLEARQEYLQAIETLQRLLAKDRSNEEAHTQLMRLYALAGQRQQALRQYQALCDTLRAELDIAPSEKTTRLFDEIQSDRFPEPTALSVSILNPLPNFPAISRRHNLPTPLSSFIGREREIMEVCQRVGQHRLVTLTGSGGVGKTRLALRAAGEILEQFAHGAWLVELAPLDDPNLVPHAVAEALEIREQPGEEILQTLERFLQPRHLLLILDNCEHVIDGVSSFAAHILQTCPNLHILATSRVILSVKGEIPFRCPSLSLPEGAVQPTPEALEQSEAVRLFIERARAIQPDFTLSEADAAPVLQICRRLDGIPLAIELAAARIRMLSVEQIAARLDHAFGLLTGGNRSELPRHQTLRALIDWSYQLLVPDEQTLLLRLSVFAGGWTLDAAEQVCVDAPPEAAPVDPFRVKELPGSMDATGLPRLEREQILDLLGRLIDRSLIEFEPSPGGAPRYRMLETVRQYARERLAERAGEGTVRARHLEYFHSLAAQAGPLLRTKQASYWLDRLDRDLDNLRQALEWPFACPEQFSSNTIMKGLDLAMWLESFSWARGHSLEWAGWMERLLQEQENKCKIQSLDLAGKVARGRALVRLSGTIKMGVYPTRLQQMKSSLDQESQNIFEELGEAYRRDLILIRYNQAETTEDYLECRSLFQATNEPAKIADCDLVLAERYPFTDKRAFFYAEELLALRREEGDVDGEGNAYILLAALEMRQGNPDRAHELALATLACYETVGNREFAAVTRSILALFYTWRGDYQEAIRQSNLLLATAQELNIWALLNLNLYCRVWLAWANEDYDLAFHLCQEAQELGGEFQHDIQVYSIYLLLYAALLQRKGHQTRVFLENILKTIMFNDIQWGELGFHVLQALGVMYVREGQMQQAATWFGVQGKVYWSDHWRMEKLSPMEHSEYEQALADARTGLGEEAFTTAWEAGRAMTVEQVIQMVKEIA